MKESLDLEILFMSEGIMEQEINRGIGGVPTDFSSVCCGKEGAEPIGKALDLPVDHRSDLHPWSRAMGCD